MEDEVLKKNNGITLITLVIAIVIITIILGISINVGFDLLEKSRAGKMITYMELVEARANAVYEDILFDSVDKETFQTNSIDAGNLIIDVTDYERFIKEENEGDTTHKSELDAIRVELGYFKANSNYIHFEWNAEILAKNGIDKNILDIDDCFIVAYDYNIQRVVGVYYNKGYAIDGTVYYSLEDLRENISK